MSALENILIQGRLGKLLGDVVSKTGGITPGRSIANSVISNAPILCLRIEHLHVFSVYRLSSAPLRCFV